MLQLLASQEPTALILEDLHWAEPTLLDLIAYIIAPDDIESRLAIVCSTRPELAETSPGFLGTDGRRRTIELGTLDSEQAAALLTDLLGDPALAKTRFASSLITNAGGNPLFLEETVRMLRDRGLIDAERWRSEEMGELPVPTSVQGLISSRLDRLEGGDKHLAHNAAVVGAVFWAGAVAHLGADEGGALPDLHAGLKTLERRDFVLHSEVSTVLGEDEYAFKHILMRDVAYGQVPKGRRAELHVRFSDWVTILPGSADEFVEIVAWHLEQACRLSREVARSPIEPPLLQAAGALANAARRAERREGLHEAERYYTRALDVLRRRASRRAARPPPPTRGHHDDDRSAQGGVRGARGGRGGRLALRPHGRRVRGIAPARRHRPAAGASGRGAPPARRGAGAWRRTRATPFSGARWRSCSPRSSPTSRVSTTRPSRACAPASPPPRRSTTRRSSPRVTYGSRRYADQPRRVRRGAETELRRCLELARELGSHRVEAEATSWLGMITYYRGDPEEGERLCRQARQWFERTGDTYFQVQNLVHGLALFALADGRPDEAETWLREAVPVALQIGGWVVVEAYRYLVEALVAQERLDDARELVAFAARNLPEEDAYARSSLLMAEAIVATATGEAATASTAFAEALRLIEELDMPLELAEARMALGLSLRTFGDVTGARAELERARAMFVRIGATTRRDAIDRELVELVEGPARAGPSTV